MDIQSKVVDLSYFLHLEATGDSEAGYFDPSMPAVINHDQNDDAESCSCEYDTTSDLLHMVIEFNYSLDDDANVGGDDEEDGEVVDQEVRLYKKCRYDPCINGIVAKESKKSSVDSTGTMNEMEKNRLFWEACLAS
ncbi:hypothetical protein like AT3G62990 [Hibiscus trionum]|uniref:Uncharacterized protein n=1 Tax=Hibiscus trionum TaxID=183268 RepID=A0A9W7HDG2_HIBTR|nr:hypothetical protein like AT3G62990 [Hibiscus trionum]